MISPTILIGQNVAVRCYKLLCAAFPIRLCDSNDRKVGGMYSHELRADFSNLSASSLSLNAIDAAKSSGCGPQQFSHVQASAREYS
jgi:hypothetical protein